MILLCLLYSTKKINKVYCIELINGFSQESIKHTSG